MLLMKMGSRDKLRNYRLMESCISGGTFIGRYSEGQNVFTFGEARTD